MVIFHPMGKELVALAQGVLQAGAHITAASSTAGNKWSLFAAARPRTKKSFDGSAMLSLEVVFSKKAALHGRVRSTKACRTSKQSDSFQ